MHRRRFAAALAYLALTLFARGASAQEPAPAPPMAGFARLIGGEWRMTRDGQAIQFDTWTWGPGRHSIVNFTHGSGSDDAPWHVLDVYYWHPGREEVRLLGLHPDIPVIGRGVSEGALTFDGDSIEARVDLFQGISPLAPRSMAGRWAFQGRERYRETLFEAPAPGAAFAELAAWDYVHAADLTPERPLDASALEVSTHLFALAPLLGGAWVGDSADLETTLTWLPLVEVVHARVTAAGAHVLDAWVYHHPTADELRVLALSARGGVHEGRLTQPERGALQLELEGHTGERAAVHLVRLERDDDGAVRTRAWLVSSTGRELVLDLQSRR